MTFRPADLMDLPLAEQATWIRGVIDSGELNPDELDAVLHGLEAVEGLVSADPSAHYVPHGAQVDFHASIVKFKCLLAGNQQGKTRAGLQEDVRHLTGDDARWEMFHWRRNPDDSYEKASLVQVRERAPQAGWLCCTDRVNAMHEVLLPELQKIMPRGLVRSWPTDRDPSIRCENGSSLTFKSWSQPVDNWQGKAVNFAHIDESCPKEYFDELLERTRTTHGKIWLCATPLKGVDFWLWDLWMDPSHWDYGADQIEFFYMDVLDVPNMVYGRGDPEAGYREKMAAIKRWGYWKDPLTKTEWDGPAEGMARVAGRFFTSSGFVYPMFSRPIHKIRPLDPGVTERWPIVRAVDHGLNHDTAALWGYITPYDDVVVFREYVKNETAISANVKGIVGMSGNILRYQPAHKRWVEVATDVGMNPIWTVLDRHCWQRDPETKRPLAEYYIRAGLKVRQGTRYDEMGRITVLREYLTPDPLRPHMMEGLAYPGPRIYITDDCPQLMWQLERYMFPMIQDERRGTKRRSERPVDRDNDTIDALEYMVCERPTYRALKSGSRQAPRDMLSRTWGY